MSKKKTTPAAKPPTVITITLPETTTLPRVGQLVIQRGMLATVRQFAYSSINDITLAIQQAATSLHILEQAPPAIAPEVSSAAMPPSTLDEPPDEPDELDDEALLSDFDSVAAVEPSPVPIASMPLLQPTSAVRGQMSLL